MSRVSFEAQCRALRAKDASHPPQKVHRDRPRLLRLKVSWIAKPRCTKDARSGTKAAGHLGNHNQMTIEGLASVGGGEKMRLTGVKGNALQRDTSHSGVGKPQTKRFDVGI
jgi:hypothetical protein